MKKLLFATILLVFAVLSCEEDYVHDPISSDGDAPAAVTNVQHVPVNGGFDITYDLPEDEDILYVKAVFQRINGETSEVRSSYYSNKIEIRGFGNTDAKEISLYSVDRSGNESSPVSFTATPLIPPVMIIEESVEINPDFGGVKFSWVNELQTPVSIQLFAENDQGNLEIMHTVYTSQSEDKYSLRGYEPEATSFAAVIRDRFDNYSDTIYPETSDKMIIPLFEEKLDKTKFRKIILANDDNWDAWEGSFENAYDDDFESIVHTQGDHPRPSIMSIDLGQNVILSRFRLYQRSPANSHWAFTHGNPKRYVVYGAKELPGSDGNLDDWIMLRECISVKPSGLPIGQNTDEDIAHFLNGDEFTFDEQIEIRYFRMAVWETWDGAGFIDFSELSFWGTTE